jgi:hypothetical protein
VPAKGAAQSSVGLAAVPLEVPFSPIPHVYLTGIAVIEAKYLRRADVPKSR